MNSPANRYLLDTFKHEMILPEVDPDACVYTHFDQSSCRACVDSCPTQAWVLDEESLGLNTDACDGCGVCIPACPGGALSVHYPWTIRQFGGRSIALFTCELSPVKVTAEVLPCIHTIGLRQLLLIYNSGIEHLLITTANCSDCERNQSHDLSKKLEQLNSLLLERDKPPMKIIQRNRSVWEKIFRTDEIISRGIRLSRREFLRGEGQQYRRQILMQDPLNLPECRTVSPGQLLPIVEKNNLHWPWVPQLNEALCNGCDACMNLCPAEALVYVPSKENLTPEYHLNPANCNGCGICENVCESDAITIKSLSQSSTHTINLIQKDCSSCGNSFHLPENTAQNETPLCRICQVHSHSKNLFQVLD